MMELALVISAFYIKIMYQQIIDGIEKYKSVSFYRLPMAFLNGKVDEY